MSLLLLFFACFSPTPAELTETPETAPEPAPVALPRLTLAPMPSLMGHTAHYVRFGQGGMRLASVSRVEGPATRIWEVETATQLQGLDVYPSGFDMDPDGARMVLGLKRVAEVWDVKRNRRLRSFPGHWDWVEQALFSRDGQWIATYDDSPALRVFDVDTGRLVAQPAMEGGLVRSMALSSSWLYWSNTRDEGVLNRWHLETGEWSALEVPFETGELDLSPDGRWLAATLTNGNSPGKNAGGSTVRVWDTESLAYRDVDAMAHNVAISADGRTVAASWRDEVRILDVDGGKRPVTATVPGGVRDLDIGADHVLAVATVGPEILLWRIGTAGESEATR